MEKEFIEKFKEALDIEEEINVDTVLSELDEWDSLGYVSTMAMIDEEYNIVVEADQLKECILVRDIIKLIG